LKNIPEIGCNAKEHLKTGHKYHCAVLELFWNPDIHCILIDLTIESLQVFIIDVKWKPKSKSKYSERLNNGHPNSGYLKP
jgi:hypothetical protein